MPNNAQVTLQQLARQQQEILQLASALMQLRVNEMLVEAFVARPGERKTNRGQP